MKHLQNFEQFTFFRIKSNFFLAEAKFYAILADVLNDVGL